MNGKDVKNLNVILERMSQADKDRAEIHTDIKFIKPVEAGEEKVVKTPVRREYRGDSTKTQRYTL